MSATSLLADVLAAEYAAIYAYGILGARLDTQTRPAARAAFDAHRARRDDLLVRLRARQQRPPGPLPSYDVVADDQDQAFALAVQVEEGLGVRWRDLVAGTDDRALRQLAVQALQDSAVRAAQWRLTAGTRPATVALPGQS